MKRISMNVFVLTVLILGVGFISPLLLKNNPGFFNHSVPLISVSDLNANSNAFIDQKVELVGIVDFPFSLGINGFFLDDCTGKVWIKPGPKRTYIPQQHTRVKIIGIVKKVVAIGGFQVFLIEEI